MPQPSLETAYGFYRCPCGIVFASFFLEKLKKRKPLVMGALPWMLRAAAAIAQFLTLIRTCLNAAAITLLTQSINVWLAYYPILQTVLGGYSPSIVAFIHEQFYALPSLCSTRSPLPSVAFRPPDRCGGLSYPSDQ